MGLRFSGSNMIDNSSGLSLLLSNLFTCFAYGVCLFEKGR